MTCDSLPSDVDSVNFDVYIVNIMIPLIVLLVTFAVLSLFGLHWPVALRIALGVMFLFTASAHWGKRRKDLVAMVPPAFPNPGLMVTLTGIFEIAGAIALNIPQTARYAVIGLALLLIAIFPANAHAARRHLTIGGRPVPALLPRLSIQIVFLAAVIAAA